MGIRAIPFTLATVVLFQAAGCSLYLDQPVTFRVRDAETNQPIEGAEVRARNMVLLDFGIHAGPRGPKDGVTDTNGEVTLVIDPKKDNLQIDAAAPGYLAEPHMWGAAVCKRLVPRRGSSWGSDFILEMYKDPAGRLDLEVPDGYRGPVLIRFAPVDCRPERVGQRQFAYDVGPNGQVAVRESGLFERVAGYGWIHAHFRDGTELATAERKSESDVPSGAVALWFISPVWEHHTWVYLIGTKADADALLEVLWGDGNHFNESAFNRLIGSPGSQVVPGPSRLR